MFRFSNLTQTKRRACRNHEALPRHLRARRTLLPNECQPRSHNHCHDMMVALVMAHIVACLAWCVGLQGVSRVPKLCLKGFVRTVTAETTLQQLASLCDSEHDRHTPSGSRAIVTGAPQKPAALNTCSQVRIWTMSNSSLRFSDAYLEPPSHAQVVTCSRLPL